jgi:hypothetical protein
MRDEPALPGAHLSSRMKKLRSDVTMMERLTSHDRPLYGRAREDVIDAFNPAEVGSALGSGVSAMKTFDAYLATGGYPNLSTTSLAPAASRPTSLVGSPMTTQT